jgi:addiction module HigA family antidote
MSAMANPIHPGRVLKEELAARGISGNRLALDLGVPANRIGAILNGKRAITADTALRLARYFGISAQFWLDLQSQHDLALAERECGAKIRGSVRAG